MLSTKAETRELITNVMTAWIVVTVVSKSSTN